MPNKPWFPLYVNDYLADTTALEAAEHGAYMLLIMAYWKQGGPLKDDDNSLRKMARVSREEWKEIRETLEPFFTVADGFWHHKRMDKELFEAEEKYQRRAKAGSKGGKQKGNSNASAMLKQEGSNAPHNSQLTTNTSSEEEVSLPASSKSGRKRNDYPDDFEQFWKAYPTSPNMAKQEAFKEWKKLDSDDRIKAFVAITPFKAWIAKQRDYTVLYAERFLKQRRFDGYAEQARPQLVHSSEQVQIAVHDEPEVFDQAVNWSKQHVPGFQEQGREFVKVPAEVAANLRKHWGKAS